VKEKDVAAYQTLVEERDIERAAWMAGNSAESECGLHSTRAHLDPGAPGNPAWQGTP